MLLMELINPLGTIGTGGLRQPRPGAPRSSTSMARWLDLPEGCWSNIQHTLLGVHPVGSANINRSAYFARRYRDPKQPLGQFPFRV